MKFRQNPVTLELEPMDDAAYFAVHHVMPEIAPYRSMKTGEWITSRAQHQEHLRRHDCFEVGNELPTIMKQGNTDFDPQGRKELYRQQIMNKPYAEFKAMVRRECQRITWNSNGLPRSD